MTAIIVLWVIGSIVCFIAGIWVWLVGNNMGTNNWDYRSQTDKKERLLRIGARWMLISPIWPFVVPVYAWQFFKRIVADAGIERPRLRKQAEEDAA